jgi:monoamine oxidase
MAPPLPQHYDIAIVGGGVAGCYCAYRLSARFPDKSIALFESASALGGRLESVFLKGVEPAAELGGCFVCDVHETTMSLLHALGLTLTPIDWSRQACFFRGRRFADSAYRNNAAAIPYAFSAHERGRSPAEILHGALTTIAPCLAECWPPNLAIAAEYLQQLRFEDRLLDDWEIGALLREVVSEAAYQSFLGAFGSAANFRNVSAYDAICTLLGEMSPQRGFVVDGGFQRLPAELARRSRAEIYVSTALTKIGEASRMGARLNFCGDNREIEIVADKVILALPPDALRRVRFDVAPADTHALLKQLSDVRAVSACKLFLSFERPWWPVRSLVSALAIGASFTDLPMQQCYYYGARDGASGLLLALFADEASTSFWRRLFRDNRAATAPAALVAESLRQLRAMHPDIAIPEPSDARARFWPAAWHAWRPGARSWRAARSMPGPHLGLPVYLCGEACSTQQGWVEGALASADFLLGNHFGLDAPL